MSRKIFSIILFVVGISSIIFPFASYEEAYFVNDTYYVTMVDTINDRYPNYVVDLIVSERNVKAAKEKKSLNAMLKPEAVLLERAKYIAKDKRDSSAMAVAQDKLDAFLDRKTDKESEIDDKWDISNVREQQLIKKIKTITDTLSVDDFIVLTANQIINPKNLSTKPKISMKHISIQKVNLQDKKPYIILGFISILLGVFVLLVAEQIIPIHIGIAKMSAFFVILIGAIYFSATAYFDLQNDIKFQEVYKEREVKVQEHLEKLADLNSTYNKEKGKYTNSWEKLIEFAKSDSAQIIKSLVNKNDTAAVNTALRNGLPLEDTLYIPISEKVYGKNNTVNLDSICIVPFSKDTFDLATDVVIRNEKDIQVMKIETEKRTFVKELSIFPENFDNFIAPLPLTISVGSLKEPTTEGNWK